MDPLSPDLISRIRARAAELATRTDAPPTARGQSVRVGPLSVQGLHVGGAPLDSRLPPAVSHAALVEAHARLGFSLPEPLAQLYLEVADGGFGPGAGLLTLSRLVETYRDLLATPPGEGGQTWPGHLVPMTWTDPGHECLDRQSGRVVYWDEELLAEGRSDRVWKRSFRDDAASLPEWWERWLATESPEARMRSQMQAGMNAALKASLDYWRSKTPAERAAMGLPEQGWEQVLFGHLGIDLTKL